MAFFNSKKSAALLKHAILSKYLVPFAAKTGSTSPGGRVAFVDGYAGEGRYDDGGMGSPGLALETSGKLLSMPRHLECVFVEKDREAFTKLTAMVAASPFSANARTIQGEIEDHMGEVLALVQDVPLLLFLDPYGLVMPFEAAKVPWMRPRGPGAPATEMLINFNSGAVRRIGGVLTTGNGPQATLRRMDEVCGGGWWRDIWHQAMPDRDAAEKAVVEEYAARLAREGNCGYWITDVRNKPHLKPVYYLIFLTRHFDGMYTYGETASKGLEEWRHAVTLEDYDETMIFDPEDIFKNDELVLRESWVREIELNLRANLLGGKAFRVVDRYLVVYGSAMGLARETHLRQAWKNLYAAKVTKTPATGAKLIHKLIEPA